jgi:hypothetical protein
LVLGAYVLAAAAGYVACFAYSGDDRGGVMRQVKQATQDLRSLGRQTRSLRFEAAEVSRKLADARTAHQHPDWSLLLAMLADSLADEVVLERCSLAPAEKTEDAAAADRLAQASPTDFFNQRFRFELGGYARSQMAVSRFTLRLEKAGLFDQVRLVKTSRQSFLGGEAVAFQLECLLDGRGRAKS